MDAQTEYWNSVADHKTFSHPLPLSDLKDRLGPDARILDYGCGYGRSCAELYNAGYRNITGVDTSSRMIDRGKTLYPHLDLRVINESPLPLENPSFDACLLVAVLTCIPQNEDKYELMNRVFRLLRPGGILFLSDYPVQNDSRNRKRYERFADEFDSYGTFRTSDGGIMHHHTRDRISALFSRFHTLKETRRDVKTMNGNPASIVQILARKPMQAMDD